MLMLLAEVRCRPGSSSGVPRASNAALTSFWQSSKLPRTLRLRMLPCQQVSCFSWRGETPPAGKERRLRCPVADERPKRQLRPCRPKWRRGRCAVLVMACSPSIHGPARHVLERGGRAMEELEHGGLAAQVFERDRKAQRLRHDGRKPRGKRVVFEKGLQHRTASSGSESALLSFSRGIGGRFSGTYRPPSGASPCSMAWLSETALRGARVLRYFMAGSGRPRRLRARSRHRLSGTLPERISGPAGLCPGSRSTRKRSAPTPEMEKPSAPCAMAALLAS